MDMFLDDLKIVWIEEADIIIFFQIAHDAVDKVRAAEHLVQGILPPLVAKSSMHTFLRMNMGNYIITLPHLRKRREHGSNIPASIFNKTNLYGKRKFAPAQIVPDKLLVRQCASCYEKVEAITHGRQSMLDVLDEFGIKGMHMHGKA